MTTHVFHKGWSAEDHQELYGAFRALQATTPGAVAVRSSAIAEDTETASYAGMQDTCLLYTSDAADDLLCVDLGGRRINKKKKNTNANNIRNLN